tara:strand:- start:84 stop:758 length:675 start_codon:yes stop_codon:yes gene_type:complete
MNFTTRVMVLEKRRKKNLKKADSPEELAQEDNKLPDGPPQAGRTTPNDDEDALDKEDTDEDTDLSWSKKGTGGRKVPKPGAKVTQGSNVNPDGSNRTTMDRPDKEDFRDDDRPTHGINASKKTKKKINADVKSGSGDLPGRDSTGAVVGGKPQMTNEPETPEQTKARKERAANAHKVNKANMQPLPDDDDSGALNASKKTKKKVNAMKETFYLRLGKMLQEKKK